MPTNTKKPHNNPPKKPQPSSSGSWAEKVRISDAAARFTLEPLPRLLEGHRLRFTEDMLMETSEQWNSSVLKNRCNQSLKWALGSLEGKTSSSRSGTLVSYLIRIAYPLYLNQTENARIYIEIDASLPYVHKFEIDTPLSPVPATVEVTYECKPSRCATCKVFGQACPTPAPIGPKPTGSILGNDPIPKPAVDQASSIQQEQQTLSATAKTTLFVPSPNVQSPTSSYLVTSPTNHQTNNPVTPHPQTKSPLVTSQPQLASQHPVTSPTYQQNSNQVTQQATSPPVTLVPLQHAPSTQLTICTLNTRDTLIPTATPPIPLQAMQDPSPDMLLICQAEDQHNEEPMTPVQVTGRVEDVHLPHCLESRMAPLNSSPPTSPIPPPPNIPNTTTLTQSPICNPAKESNKASSSSSSQVKKKRGSRKRRGGI
ncbi:hypothetical protein DKX38_026128 [Salix brachista]|uniref:Uncharacterized protein n=1 Tax=Salix brachista TaxID=2182728 RepID=A0A5N5JRD1_9ROSI|nr:hypothetical protein DKX38_026128 [Salix brachista]